MSLGSSFGSFKASKPSVRSTRSRGRSGYMMPPSSVINRAYDLEDIENARQQAAINPFDRFNIQEDVREDYEIEPTFRSVHGVPIEEGKPKLKPMAPTSMGNLINSTRSQARGIQDLMSQAKSSPVINRRLGPISNRPEELFNLGAHRGLIGDAAMSLESMMGSPSAREFNEFKNRLERFFQQYRDQITGAQASYQELQGLLAPLSPHASDPPDKFFSAAQAAIEDMKINDQVITEYVRNQGYRSSGFRKGSPFENMIQGQSQTSNLSAIKDRFKARNP